MSTSESEDHTVFITGELIRQPDEVLWLTIEYSPPHGIVTGFFCSIERGKKIFTDSMMLAIQHLYDIHHGEFKDVQGKVFKSELTILPGKELKSNNLCNDIGCIA